MIVKDRQQMAQLLDDRMRGTYESLADRQELGPESSLVKTYLLESHMSEGIQQDEANRFFERIFSNGTLGKASTPELIFTKEEGFVNISTSYEREPVILYVDYSNPRFWIVHSTASSIAVDYIIDRLSKYGPEVDRTWIPAELLEEMASVGPFRGLSLDFDRRWIHDLDIDSPDEPVEFLKMQLWGNKAGDILKLLRKESAFRDATTLSKIKVKYYLNGDSGEEFTLDDIKYDGKITARGTSFQSHISLVTQLSRSYSNEINGIEQNYILRTQPTDEFVTLEGSPLFFRFSRSITQLDQFAKRLFSSGHPFRLWGTPIRVNDTLYRVHAVDLHVGNPVDIEISPDFLCVYLPERSCGNTIIRLYTNFQHYYDSQVQLIDGDGNSALQFQSDTA